MRAGAGFLAALLAASPLVAQHNFTQEELLSLPRSCLAQKFINQSLDHPVVPNAERAQWEERLGSVDYIHFHHYCHALILVRRGNKASTARERASNFNDAVSNFGYVQRNASAAFPLMPEVNLQKGLTLRLLGNDAEAAREFIGALRLKPTYTPAYAALIDVYLELGDWDEARRVLEQGLAHTPSSKILASKRAEMDALAATKR